MHLIYKMNLLIISICVLCCKSLVSGYDMKFRGQEFISVPSIPDQIPTDIEILDLSGNNLSFVSSADFEGLTKINTLALASNFLTEFPHLLSVSGTLTALILSSNEINFISADYLDILDNIEILLIDDNQLTSIPDVDGPSSTLRSLSLSKNHFPSFPSLSRLGKSVTSFRFEENDIREVDAKALQLLTKLEKLYVQRNQLKTIPIPATSKLNSLTIYQNPLACDPRLAWLLAEGLTVIGFCETPEHLKRNRTNTLSLEDLGIVEGNISSTILVHWCLI